jgi:predicted SprT family Zn-dependent metalloprotease
MTPLQVAQRESANCAMSGEEDLARKYCEPKAYWHCTRELSGGRYYTFDELNYPQHWLRVVAKYTQREPSPAARQLHRRVEEHRTEFRAKQEKIYGDRSLYQISRHRESIEAKELRAWNTFNAQKQACLKDYLRATATGVVARKRAGHRCRQCNAAKVVGRARYCDLCAKQRQRDSLRASRSRQRQNRLLGDINSFSGTVQPEGLTKAKNSKKGHLATTIAEGVKYGFTFTDKDAAFAKPRKVARV